MKQSIWVIAAMGLAATVLSPVALADKNIYNYGYQAHPATYKPYKKHNKARYRNAGHKTRGASYGKRASSFTDVADVIHVEPIVRYVMVQRQEQVCWHEDVQTGGYESTAGNTIAGGVVGGVIGRQFGDGKGRDAMTLLGTLVGSAIGNDRASRRNYYEPARVETVERCGTQPVSHQEERVDGYNVTYRYQGREYTTRTSYDPGATMNVRVSVTPTS